MYVVEPTEDLPKVCLDPTQGNLLIEGTSIPEDSEDFYAPILDWLAEFVASEPEKVEFQIRLEYFNTSSSKYILDMLRIIEPLSANSKLSVIWYYHPEDEDMLEAGEDYKSLVKIPFNLVPTTV